MGPIILSRNDCDSLMEIIGASLGPWAGKLLANGTPGFTWVQLLPDKVLEDMEYYYDPEPNDDNHAAPIYAGIINEIERRSNVTTSN